MVIKKVASAIYVNEEKRKNSKGMSFYELYSSYGEEGNPTELMMGTICIDNDTDEVSVRVGQFAVANNFKEIMGEKFFIPDNEKANLAVVVGGKRVFGSDMIEQGFDDEELKKIKDNLPLYTGVQEIVAHLQEKVGFPSRGVHKDKSVAPFLAAMTQIKEELNKDTSSESVVSGSTIHEASETEIPEFSVEDDINIEDLSNKIMDNVEQHVLKPCDKYLISMACIHPSVRDEALAFNDFLENHGTEAELKANEKYVEYCSKIIHGMNAEAYKREGYILETKHRLVELEKAIIENIKETSSETPSMEQDTDKQNQDTYAPPEINEPVIDELNESLQAGLAQEVAAALNSEPLPESTAEEMSVEDLPFNDVHSNDIAILGSDIPVPEMPIPIPDDVITRMESEAKSETESSNTTQKSENIDTSVSGLFKKIDGGEHNTIEFGFEDFQKSSIHNILKDSLSNMINSWRRHIDGIIKDTSKAIGSIISDVKMSVANKEKRIIIEHAKYSEKAMKNETEIKASLIADIEKIDDKIKSKLAVIDKLNEEYLTENTKTISEGLVNEMRITVKMLEKEIDAISKERARIKSNIERAERLIKGYKQDLISARCVVAVKDLPLEQQKQSYLDFIQQATKNCNSLEFVGTQGQSLRIENSDNNSAYYVDDSLVTQEKFLKHIDDHSVKNALVGYEMQRDVLLAAQRSIFTSYTFDAVDYDKLMKALRSEIDIDYESPKKNGDTFTISVSLADKNAFSDIMAENEITPLDSEINQLAMDVMDADKNEIQLDDSDER